MSREESTIFSGKLTHLLGNPFEGPNQLEIIERGSLLVNAEGKIVAYGRYDDLIRQAPDATLVDFSDAWLIPGLIDGHIHYPQAFATASPSGQLLEWLETAIFPEEARLSDPAYAQQVADLFLQEMLSSGTTMAAIFGSQFAQANQLLLSEMGNRGFRAIVGVTLMDRQGPTQLCMNPEQGYEAVETLIAACGEFGDIACAVTPRFALSCSEEMLEMCGQLLARHPHCYAQTHINENPQEIHAVRKAFPTAQSYLDVYDRYGLLGPKTILAHSIHTTPSEMGVLAEKGCVICHCPSSNLFLGSGIFPLRAHHQKGIPVLLGTDVGAGTTFSIVEEMGHALMLQKLRDVHLDAGQMLYLSTLGAANALGRDHDLGNFESGKWADFVVLDPRDDIYLKDRLSRCSSVEEQLFALLVLHKGRRVKATYIAGQPKWVRN